MEIVVLNEQKSKLNVSGQRIDVEERTNWMPHIILYLLSCASYHIYWHFIYLLRCCCCFFFCRRFPVRWKHNNLMQIQFTTINTRRISINNYFRRYGLYFVSIFFVVVVNLFALGLLVTRCVHSCLFLVSVLGECVCVCVAFVSGLFKLGKLNVMIWKRTK